MRIQKITILTIISLLFFVTNNTYSQIVKPTGTTDSSSQLVYYYDNSGEEIQSYIQVTNDNDTEPVWIHVQIWFRIVFISRRYTSTNLLIGVSGGSVKGGRTELSACSERRENRSEAFRFDAI